MFLFKIGISKKTQGLFLKFTVLQLGLGHCQSWPKPNKADYGAAKASCVVDCKRQGDNRSTSKSLCDSVKSIMHKNHNIPISGLWVVSIGLEEAHHVDLSRQSTSHTSQVLQKNDSSYVVVQVSKCSQMIYKL